MPLYLLTPEDVAAVNAARKERASVRGARLNYKHAPLTDGDALRLAVKLSLRIHTCQVGGFVVVDDALDVTKLRIVEHYEDDPYVATCRAIFRAAAKMTTTED